MDFIFYVMVIEIICGRCDVSKAIYDHDHDEISCEMTFGSHVDNLQGDLMIRPLDQSLMLLFSSVFVDAFRPYRIARLMFVNENLNDLI